MIVENSSQLQNLSSNTELFYKKANNYRYGEPTTLEAFKFSDSRLLIFPVNVDTEFEHKKFNYDNPVYASNINQTITCQIKHKDLKEGLIFAHLDSKSIARHQLFESEWVIFDYLNLLGFQIDIERYSCPVRVGRTLQIDMYAHFLIAELFRVFQGELRKDIQKLTLGRVRNKQITQGRRTIASSRNYNSNLEEQFVDLSNWIVTLNGIQFNLRLALYDTIAVAGNQSLDTLAQLAGHELQYKSIIESSDKSRMTWVYQNQAEEFDKYALGDLDVYEILIKLENRFQRIYEDLGLISHWKEGHSMRLTIGATVAKLLEAALKNHTGVNDKVLRGLTKHGTSETLKKGNTTACYLAKVDGGRCRNNRPTEPVVKNRLICDIDISGCYGNGLKNQTYPIGRPVIIGYPLDSNRNSYMTVAEFIKSYGNDLVPGLWFARVSYKENYKPKYGQDFFTSWIPPKNIDNLPTDTDLESIEWWTDDNTGLNKIFTHEINMGILNHDGLEWIKNIASQRQRKELLENLVVVSVLYYPKSNQVDSVQTIFDDENKHTGSNTVKVKGSKNKKIISNIQECHSWYGVNLGELIVNRLIKERSNYPKKDAFNQLYKLIINTIYGDEVSPYFEIGNSCVGNNITARARAMAWYMEKGFHGFQTITDGCAFDINRVIHPDKTRLTSETVFEAYYKGTDESNFIFAPLNQCEIKVSEWIKVNKGECTAKLVQNETEISYADLAEMAHKHLKQLFPNVVVINQFNLEIKNVYQGIATHASANYVFKQGDGTYTKAKMRSYGKRANRAVQVNDTNKILITVGYEPANEFLKEVYENPNKVNRSKAFIDESILKIPTYKANYDSRWENSTVFPGCTIERVRLLREFSLNQFTYKNSEQFRCWEREITRLIRNYDQSIEAFFLNKDETLDLLKMLVITNDVIRMGLKPSDLRKRIKIARPGLNSYKNHTGSNAVKKMKGVYQTIYGYGMDMPDSDIECDSWMINE